MKNLRLATTCVYILLAATPSVAQEVVIGMGTCVPPETPGASIDLAGVRWSAGQEVRRVRDHRGCRGQSPTLATNGCPDRARQSTLS